MTIEELTEKLQLIIDGYADRFKIQRDDDWFVLKIQEELGELASAYLKLTHRGRRGDRSHEELERNLEEEVSDVLAMTLLFARHRGIDVQKALHDKWLKHLGGTK